ncbi:hypothetical protein CPB86DRAFT_814523 [Serendipita vermifera]|nr:hypothetical protein CPB86DRAFT_814523 [Serendipita vermifera]
MSRSSSRKSLTPESLVSVLVPHISQQTLLLPTLHAQLGLPPSALESDLADLREALLKTVEDCVSNRKKEITQWEAKCEGVEARCRRLENAMGRRAASLAELKKQTVYPVRHEQLSAQEDKLNQLYSSKLEQLNTLTTRLSNLASTLGSSFYSDDILNPTPAPGELEGHTPSASKNPDTSVEDDEALYLRDVTPERFNRLEKELMRGKSEIQRRLVSLSALFEQIAWLYTELGILLPISSEPLPSITDFPYPKPFQSKVARRTDPFRVMPSPDPQRQRNEYMPLFAAYVTKLQEAVDEGREASGVEGVDPTPTLIEWFEHLKSDLDEEKSRRETHIQDLYDQLEILWKRMGISDADIDDFVELNRGSAIENVRAYEMELERMLEMKRERMSVFIGNARAEIERLWDDLMWSEEEREVFAAFHDDEHTEDLLNIHEEEIARLKEERRSKAPILVSIRKYYQVCDEQKQLEASASDQSRLLGRGARGDPGRLLREEKMRKRVQKEKPRLEQELIVSVPEWEAENGKPLLVNGIHFLGILEEAVRAEEAKAESKKRPRTNSTVGRAITPAPVSANNATRKASAASSITPSLRSASGSSHASTAFSMSTNSTASSVLGPASKRKKLNNAHPLPVEPPLSSVTSSTVVSNAPKSTRPARLVLQRPASRQDISKTVTTPTTATGTSNDGRSRTRRPLSIAESNTPTTTYQPLPSGVPTRAPSRAAGSRAQSPSKIATLSAKSKPGGKDGVAPVVNSTQVKGLIFPTNTPNLLSKEPKSDESEEESIAARPKRRESFKPRPSSPGLGREYAEMWRGKQLLRDDILSDDDDDSD